MLVATWRQHAKTEAYRRAKYQALHAIDEALLHKSRRWMVGLSGGKDSLAMAWMLKVHGSASDMTFAHATCEFLCPGMLECSESAGEKLDLRLDIFEPDWSPYADGWAFLRSLPAAASIYDKSITSELHKRCASGNMLVAYQYANDFTGCFSGVRADESHGRRMNRIMRGTVYRIESDDTVMAQPIVDWKARDVWAAVIESGLEYPAHYRAIYERFGISPESPRSRVDSLFVTERVNTYCGAMHTTRVLYPKLWRQLVDARPELGNEA
jgi:3'-phosphoadenosine 5'-phosphosulfate sulfotransferase (PAPS reductase)/FAD synthetase